jgi:uncharacterized membrane protein YbhN (UPF0104 family)
MAAHYTTPAKIGFPLTVYLLNKLENVPYAIGTTVILIELFMNTSFCGIIAFFGSLSYFTEKSSVLLLSSVSFLFLFLFTYYGARIFLARSHRVGRISQFIQDICDAFSCISFQSLIMYSLLILIVHLFGGFSLALLSFFFDTRISLWQAVVANSAAFFLGSLSMIPMGLGVREGSLIFYLSQFGVPNEVAIAIVVVQRLLSTGLSLVLGITLASLLGLRNITKNPP